jgi:hypothetical protein
MSYAFLYFWTGLIGFIGYIFFSPPICFPHSRRREHRVFDFFIFSVDPRGIGSAFHRARCSEKIKHTPCGQGVYFFILLA